MLQRFRPRRFGALRLLFDFARLRAALRRSELGLLFAGIAVGVSSGCAVTAMSLISQQMHRLIFGINDTDRLSSSEFDNKLLLLAAPVVGGTLLGLLIFILAKTRKKPMVDPIEANALHGGRMSLTDSIVVAVQNLISNGFGASVGLEAG